MSVAAALFAFISAAIAALCASSDGALLALEEGDDLTESLAKLYRRRERVHRALAFARVLGQLGAGIGVAIIVTALVPGGLAAAGVIALAAILIVALTESAARSIGDVHGLKAAARLLPWIGALERLLAPVVALGEILDRGLDTLLPRRNGHEEDRGAAAEQFRQIVAAEAEVSKEQEVLLTGVFRLAETEVHDIMVPRIDVVAIDREATWAEVVDRFRASEHSRLPVFDGTIDNIVGVLYAKDILPAVLDGIEPSGGWTTLMRPAVFIPGAKKADDQLRDFRGSGSHFAVVVDEFGGTAGIITIEDVLEEIVGDIRDEYDVEEASVVQEDGRRFWVSARLTLNELSDLLHHPFERDGVATVGGLIYELLGRVPRAGEELVLEGFRVVVEKVERRRVRRVFFERLDVNKEHAA